MLSSRNLQYKYCFKNAIYTCKTNTICILTKSHPNYSSEELNKIIYNTIVAKTAMLRTSLSQEGVIVTWGSIGIAAAWEPGLKTVEDYVKELFPEITYIELPPKTKSFSQFEYSYARRNLPGDQNIIYIRNTNYSHKITHEQIKIELEQNTLILETTLTKVGIRITWAPNVVTTSWEPGLKTVEDYVREIFPGIKYLPSRLLRSSAALRLSSTVPQKRQVEVDETRETIPNKKRKLSLSIQSPSQIPSPAPTLSPFFTEIPNENFDTDMADKNCDVKETQITISNSNVQDAKNNECTQQKNKQFRPFISSLPIFSSLTQRRTFFPANDTDVSRVKPNIY